MPAESSVAVIGLGSRGLGVLERLLTLSETLGAAGRLRIEVIDPDGSGSGVHRRDQPDYLLLNTICDQVSMFPDRHSVGDAVGMIGPSLYQWVTDRGLRLAEDGFTVGPRGRVIEPTDFLPRRVLGEYLAWFRDQLLDRCPERVTVTIHRDEAIQLHRDRSGLRVELASGTLLDVHYAFLTTGYTANQSTEPEHGPGPAGNRVIDPYPIPQQLEPIEPGQTVAIAGFGLSAMDVMSALTVGRGGRYARDGAGLRYHPSGAEPELVFYSRSGLPCRARPKVLRYGPTHRPLIFTDARLRRLQAAAPPTGLDFAEQIWPLVLSELRVAYRWWSASMAGGEAAARLQSRLEAHAAAGTVPALLDELDAEHGRFDPESVLGPHAPMPAAGSPYQSWLIDELKTDLVEGELGLVGSQVKSTLDILRQQRDTFRLAIDFGAVTPSSLGRFMSETVPLINRAVVGPQFERHVELIALLEAGVARAPLGPDPVVEPVGASGQWLLRPRNAIGSRDAERSCDPDRSCAVVADWLVTGRVDLPAVAASASPLLTSLYRQGIVRPLQPASRVVVGIDIDADHHPLDVDGEPERRLWVLGPLCEGATFYNNLVPSPGAFSRPVHDAHRCVVQLLSEGSRREDLVGQTGASVMKVVGAP